MTFSSTARQTAPSIRLPSNVHHHDLDLSSRKAVQAFVNSWSYGPLSALICNAGMVAGDDSPTFDSNGVELCFAVNHVNQALLFFLLKEKDLLARRCRLVFLTTAQHDPKQPLNQTPPFWPDTETVAKATNKGLSNRGVRYSTAKLGTVFFGYALASKLKKADKEWTVIVYEPGFVPGGGSRLQRGELHPCI